jgi:lipopolysaccharide/colanic/teichoic acid biosynthesis glycosyltransferase
MPSSEHHHYDEEHHDEADEDRKTRFGTFMRKTGIDELPQFFNVLFGSMSIVGPRPELPMYVEEYRKTIPLYMVKHQVKPGITGLAQIYGFRGDNTSIERRIELDLRYIENWTLFNDLKIIITTPFKILNRNEKYKKKK